MLKKTEKPTTLCHIAWELVQVTGPKQIGFELDEILTLLFTYNRFFADPCAGLIVLGKHVAEVSNLWLCHINSTSSLEARKWTPVLS